MTRMNSLSTQKQQLILNLHFHLDGERTLFIDDAPANVEGARLAGWNAVLFTDPEKLKSDLAAHGIPL